MKYANENKGRKCDNEQNVVTRKIRPGTVPRFIRNLRHIEICFVLFTIITSLHNLAADSTANVAASPEELLEQPTKRFSDSQIFNRLVKKPDQVSIQILTVISCYN